jgi:hypothetical protein
LDSAVEAAASDEAMILRSKEVPKTFSKCAVNKPVVVDALGVKLSRLRAIEWIIGFVFRPQY